MANLADALIHLGDFQAAAGLEQQTLDPQSTLGETHPSTLATMANLADSLEGLVDFQAAADLERKTHA